MTKARDKKKQGIVLLSSLVVLVLLLIGVIIGAGDKKKTSQENKQISPITLEAVGMEKEQESDKPVSDTSASALPDTDSTTTAEADAGKTPDADANTQSGTGNTSDSDKNQTSGSVKETDTSKFVYPESEGGRKAYLTFDDGSSEQTDKILDILKKYNVKATFFVTKQSGEKNAARYRRIVAEGHSIGLHSVSHNYKKIYASMDSFVDDVEGIRAFVKETTGVDSHLYRFPGGSSNRVSKVDIEDCIRYLKKNGYRYFDWNIDTSDSVNRNQNAGDLVSQALGKGIDSYHNCVILMHDSAYQSTTVEALPKIIEGLQAKGLEILPITDATPAVQHKKAESVK